MTNSTPHPNWSRLIERVKASELKIISPMSCRLAISQLQDGNQIINRA
jgi:hypothetical protein